MNAQGRAIRLSQLTKDKVMSLARYRRARFFWSRRTIALKLLGLGR